MNEKFFKFLGKWKYKTQTFHYIPVTQQKTAKKQKTEIKKLIWLGIGEDMK